MPLIIADSYDLLSQQASDLVTGWMKERNQPLLCAASGDSPLGLYQHLVISYKKGQLNPVSWSVVGLDEWLGMNADDTGSCGYTVQKELTLPLGIHKNNQCFFDGRNPDTDSACNQVDQFIADKGGMDVAILGLGMNGHIGLNEPGTPASRGTHVSQLEALTSQVGQKYFDRPASLQQGITLGIASLLKAKQLLLLVSGAKKAPILQKMMQGPVTESLPATLFLSHPSFFILADREAASLLH